MCSNTVISYEGHRIKKHRSDGDGQKSWEGLEQVVPVDKADGAHHVEAHNHERHRASVLRDRFEQWRDDLKRLADLLTALKYFEHALKPPIRFPTCPESRHW